MTPPTPASSGATRGSRRMSRALATLTAVGVLAAAGTASATSKVFVSGYSNDTIGAISADGTGLTAIVPSGGASGPFGTTVDAAAGKVYWVNYGSATSIGYADLDGSNAGSFPVTGANSYGLSLDPATDMLYWSPEGDDSIRRIKTDGTGEEEFLNLTDFPANWDAVAPVVDSAAGRLYVMRYGEPRFAYANLDGSLIDGQKTKEVVADPTT